jgi:hypothetical protein
MMTPTLFSRVSRPLAALSLAAVMSFGTIACDDQAEKNRQAEAARVDAEKKAAEATAEAETKAANLQAAAQQGANTILAKGEEKAADAKQDAKEAVVDAKVSLEKARIDAKTEGTEKLASIEKDIVDVRQKIDKKLPKAEAAAVAQDLTAKTDEAKKQIRALETATSTELEGAKNAVKVSLDALSQAVAKAKDRV